MPTVSRPFGLCLGCLIAALPMAGETSGQTQPAAPSAAPPAAQPATPTSAPDAIVPAIVMRDELASRYLAVDALFQRVITGPNPPTPEKTASFNRQFDDATALFFGGRTTEAVRALHELERDLTPRDPMPRTIGTGLSLRVQPRVWWTGAAPPRLTLRSYAPAQVSTTGKLAITAVSRGQATTLFERDFQVEAGKVVIVEEPLPETNWPRGESVRLIATLDGVSETAEAPFSVVDSSLDALRESLLKRLAALKPAEQNSDETAGKSSEPPATVEPGHDAEKAAPPRVPARVIEIARGRLAALTDNPSNNDAAQFLADPPALARELSAEVEAIEGGHNPYSHRIGAYQRPQGKSQTPCSIYAPKVAASDQPLPLVIALHGAGGDDSMFIRGYGGGLLCRLADDRGFLVAAPLTYKLAGNAPFFDELIEDLARDYAIDRDRVYVIGHSLGGGVAMYLAQARASSIAASACIAGAGPVGKRVVPCPTLVVGAELDRIGGPANVRPLIQSAIADGKPVEYREVKNYGHTLVVGRALPEVVEWLFQHTLANRPPREPRENGAGPPALKPADVRSNEPKTKGTKPAGAAVPGTTADK